MCGMVQLGVGRVVAAKAKARRVRPNLWAYDWIVVNSSGGKDSQAMLDEVFWEAVRQGVVDRVVVAHADLGRVEWPGTKELAQQQAEHYGLPFFVVRRPQGDLIEHVRQRAAALKAKGKVAPAWPSPSARYCTSHHKVDQIDKLVTQLAKGTPPWFSPENRYCTADHKRGQVSKLIVSLAKKAKTAKGKRHKPRILNCMGLRHGESTARSKLQPFKLDKRQSGSVVKVKDAEGKTVKVWKKGRAKTVHTWLPIFGWTVQEVWQRIEQTGVPHHYAYDLGMPRLSCVFCIFSPREALMLAGKHNRELLAEYVRLEEEVGYSFRQQLSLADIEAALERGEEPGPVPSWEM